MNTAQRLQQLRKEKGMSQEELAGRLGENGRLIFACENALGLSFLSGDAHDGEESAFTREEIRTACAGAGERRCCWPPAPGSGPLAPFLSPAPGRRGCSPPGRRSG